MAPSRSAVAVFGITFSMGFRNIICNWELIIISSVCRYFIGIIIVVCTTQGQKMNGSGAAAGPDRKPELNPVEKFEKAFQVIIH